MRSSGRLIHSNITLHPPCAPAHTSDSCPDTGIKIPRPGKHSRHRARNPTRHGVVRRPLRPSRQRPHWPGVAPIGVAARRASIVPAPGCGRHPAEASATGVWLPPGGPFRVDVLPRPQGGTGTRIARKLCVKTSWQDVPRAERRRWSAARTPLRALKVNYRKVYNFSVRSTPKA